MGLDEDGSRAQDTIAIPEVSALVRRRCLSATGEGSAVRTCCSLPTRPACGRPKRLSRKPNHGIECDILRSEMRPPFSTGWLFSELPAYTKWVLQFRFPEADPRSMKIFAIVWWISGKRLIGSTRNFA